MNIVTTTSVFPPCYSAEDALLRLKKCGFRHLDLAIDYMTQDKSFPFLTSEWENWAKSLRALADENGVTYTHAHACGSASSRSSQMLRGFQVCKILGIRYIVVHPIYKNADQKIITDPDEFVALNAKEVQPLLKIADECGVTVLSENLLWGASIPPAVISALVEEVNSPNFGWCYDVGHAHCQGFNNDALLGLKHPPLSLHIHDNQGHSNDEHLIPGDGTVDWKRFVEVLLEVGYQGDLVLEAHHQSLDLPDEERDTHLSKLYQIAQKINCDYTSLANAKGRN